VSTLFIISNVSLFFIRIPLLAHNPSLTTIANGVARPKAQGQATTKTDTNVFRVSLNGTFKIKLIRMERKAIIKTIGTK